jgi:hypothetical protein
MGGAGTQVTAQGFTDRCYAPKGGVHVAARNLDCCKIAYLTMSAVSSIFRAHCGMHSKKKRHFAKWNRSD